MLGDASQAPVPGQGKKLDKMGLLAIGNPLESDHSAGRAINLSPSTSQRSISGPHSVEVAARLMLQDQKEVFDTTTSPPQKKHVPAPSEITVVPETAVKGILERGLMMATTGLLKTMKEAAFADVEKIAREAPLVYRCVKHLKGNPTRLQEKIESYSAVVKAFCLLEEATSERQRCDDINREIALEREGLETDGFALETANKECIAIAEMRSSVEKVIADLEDKLKRACEMHNQLETDMDTLERSCDDLQNQVRAREARIAELETAPKLNAEDVATLEEQRRSVLELQSSLDPDGWLDLVT
ncbi:hypothetical protein RND81_14G083000 [Saponaria officinalis]|uniref:Uncharacterized protein n=1 Tax=Saponaria officinalis TaxID=3572 RepID=A0AAW1GJW6_SAPOF